MAINPEPEESMESESEVVNEGSSEEVDSEESDYESDNESDNKSELTHVARERSEDAVVVGVGGAKPRLITGESSLEKMMLTMAEPRLITSEPSTEKMVLKMGKEYFEAGEGIEGEKEWQKMRLMECKLNLRLLEVRAAQTKLVLNGLNGFNH